MTEVVLETERLILRNWQSDADWEAFFAGTNTPGVMHWLGGVMDESGMAAQRARVETCAADNGFCFWAVERKDDGAILGFCGLKRINTEGSPSIGDFEIGWRFAEFAQGQGYAREAAERAMRAAFEDYGAPYVVALTVIQNEPSWRLMQKLGMERRPDLDFTDLRWGSELQSTIVYAISHVQWRNQWKARETA